MSFKTSFQWFADFNTSTTGMQIVQFSAGGDIVRRRLAPMFAHYRKYKLGAIHVKFVPAATLPVDPTGLSYAEGENTVDPRDLFNPGLVRTTNGEDVYVPDDTVLESEMADSLYYSTMLDKRWKKFRLQRGITLRAFPRFWGVANLRQNMFPDLVTNSPNRVSSANDPNTLVGTTNNVMLFTAGANFIGNSIAASSSGSNPMGLFQTGEKIPMGWMPTGASLRDEFSLLNGLSGDVAFGKNYRVIPPVGFADLIADFDTRAEAEAYLAEISPAFPEGSSGSILEVPNTADASSVDAGVAFAPVPEIPDLLTLVLPRSRKTQFFYRIYVKEDVYFSDPVTSINAIEAAGDNNYYAPIDQFVRSKIGVWSPGLPVNDRERQTIPYNDGGNRE